MGRIVTSIRIQNYDLDKEIRCDALVDTGSSYLVLPSAWKDRLGEYQSSSQVEFEVADQTSKTGTVCGPVRIEVEGFRPVYNEVLFIDMKPDGGSYEPLLGYIILEQCQAAVDMLGHRLIEAKRMDLK